MIYVIELGVDVIMSCVMGDCSWSLCWLVMFYYLCVWFVSLFFFFFQAEDGIRDIGVTGVQTCALPISPDGQADRLAKLFLIGAVPARRIGRGIAGIGDEILAVLLHGDPLQRDLRIAAKSVARIKRDSDRRSEERRVGKEGRSRWSPYH